MIPKITYLCCLLAACATVGIFAFVIAHHRTFNWAAFLMFSGWNTAVYGGIVFVALVHQASRRASIVMLVCTLLIAGFSMYCLYRNYRIYFLGRYTYQTMNCVGPIVELGLPLLQWPTLFVFTIISFFCGGDARRVES